ncbi:hypothetical protein IVB45_02220 [Bradyrhizobium sp. 4]|uniref:hypothetical protein n=1 Tax=Bradyrhizobium sp. 4 TaxID=2782678 RepID=UPI001FFE844B|nr:hypothetical protein [Bradyrhizobium sp. 4]UPJ35850.1 hypothetical protein IVB45_02220 [Bradyrhizobium sp. 4]
MIIPDYSVNTFLGLNTAIKDTHALKPGVSPDSLNWITGKDKDHIELRRGYARLGMTAQAGNGKITGLGVGMRYDGTQIPFYSHGRKVKYYDVTTDDGIEVGSNLLPATADGEDVWMRSYQNLAGSFMYLGSPNSGIYKIPAANPGSAVDQSITTYRFKVFQIGQGRAFAGQRNGTTPGNKDATGLYLSYIDHALLSAFPAQTTGEAYGTGDGVTKTFAHTLSGISAPKTAMYAAVTDGTETFTDDRSGGMEGNLGGTGTINYATGAVSVTFATAPANLAAMTCSYYYETASSGGILDFSGSSNGQGKSFRQDDGGGNLMAIYYIGNVAYCFHPLKTWQVTTALDDTDSTNLHYRDVGISYQRAAFQTPEGIIFADLSRPTDPKFRRLQVLQGTTNTTIEPLSISDALDLSGYAFDYCVAFRWGDYEMFCFQEKVNGTANTFNSKMLVRNTLSGSWDLLNYYASCLAEYNGTLIAGDSISNNVYTLFSGYDEDGDVIENYWKSGDLNLDSDRLKTTRRMVIAGLIQPDQNVDVSVSYDSGEFTKVYTIEGNASYVDSGIDTYIGGPTIGSKTIGSGGSSVAHPFTVDFPLNSDKYVYARIKFEATDIGFAQINDFTFKDNRDKGRKNLPVRTT